MDTPERQFLNNVDFNEACSFTHLLHSYETEEDTFDPLCVSKYYNKGTFIESMTQSNSDFSMISINCQSLTSKFDEFQTYFDEINSKHLISAIICQETGFTNTTDLSLYQLAHYNMVSKYANKLTGHGLVIYLHEDYIFEEITTENENTKWECLFLEICQNKLNAKKYIIGNVYRKPIELLDSLNIFINEFHECITELKTKQHPVYIGGDFNINLLDIFRKQHYNTFYENVIHSGFYPKITLPTRLQYNTLIDNILVNRIDNHVSGILLETFSDHQIIFTHNKSMTPIKFARKIVIENETRIAINEFVKQLEATNWNEFTNNLNSDPNINYNKLIEILQNLKNKTMPRKYIKFKKRKHKKQPWITTGIIKSINKKDEMYKRLIKMSTDTTAYEELKINFKTYQRIIRRSIREAKRTYYHNIFIKYNGNTKKTWQIINSTLNKKNTHSSLPLKFHDNGKILTDPCKIANKLNDFFVNVGTHLNDSTDTLDEIDSYLTERTQSSFNFHTIDSEITLQIIKNMKNKSSRGHDSISNKLIKSAQHILCKPLTLIINQMIHTNIYPNSLKIAKIVPIFKKGDKFLFSNYRPISLLPSLSKIFERVIFLQITQYLNTNNLITNIQYGFRKQHSTELAALHLTDHLIWETNNKQKPLTIFLDLSKAFDSLDHSILLHKLKYYGFVGNSYELIKNYISDRKQFVIYNETESQYLKMKQGVPQGSILGPLLFLLYINDFPKCSDFFKFLMYADDTTLYCNLTDICSNNKENFLNHELNNIYNWLTKNKLSLNVNKTKAMTFRLKKNNQVVNLNLKINNNQIENVNTFNFLGLTINSQLKWKSHTDIISIKITKVIGIINKLKLYYPQHILLTLYNTLILPHINYCILTWGTFSENILLLQKKALRALTLSDSYTAHSEPIFKTLNLLKAEDIFKQKLLMFYYNLKHNHLPIYFNDFDPKPSQGSTHYEFRNPRLQPPNIVLETTRQTTRYQLPILLNKISHIDNIRQDTVITINIHSLINTCSLKTYKYKVKCYFLDSYSMQCNKVDCFQCQRS